jgi:hypothetical protein
LIEKIEPLMNLAQRSRDPIWKSIGREIVSGWVYREGAKSAKVMRRKFCHGAKI